MSKNVDIEVFPIAKTVVDKVEVRKWLDYLEVSEDWQFPDEELVSNAALLIALAGRRCYRSFEVGQNPNVTRIRKDYHEYFDNIFASQHGSILEHSVYTFALEGVSRVCLAELNRHRAGCAISEGSLRFIRFNDFIPWWSPPSITVKPEDNEDLKQRKNKSFEIFHRAFSHQRDLYKELLDVWDMDADHHNFHYKKTVTSCLRRIIGMGVASGGCWSFNIRALRHIIAMRCSPQAEEEIAYVFGKVIKYLKEEEPLLFGDFYQDEQGFWRPKYVKV